MLSQLTVDTLLFAPHERVTSLMNGDVPMCTPYRLKTQDREKVYVFSLPTDIFFNRRLYQHKSSQPLDGSFLNNQGDIVNLVDMMASSSDYTLLVGADHSYGDFLDNMIAQIPPHSLYTRHGIDPYTSMIQMLSKGRIDFYLSYPSVIRSGPVAENVRSYGIAGMPSYEEGHLMCNDLAESRAFLTKFNAALIHLYRSGAFSDMAEKYMSNSEGQQLQRIVADILTMAD
ncbi:hypothetical protein [Alteromonas sp. D210916BOD_24]|uniref:hypothetical protein n=1 Tax=Alteromonas sp. D210916BOD_24 TaxID=3157618 RepID=UPI00399C6B27